MTPIVICSVLAVLLLPSIFVTGLILSYSDPWFDKDTFDSADGSSLTYVFEAAKIMPAAHVINTILLISAILDCCVSLYIATTIIQDLADHKLAPSILQSPKDRDHALSPYSLGLCCMVGLGVWALTYIRETGGFVLLGGVIGISGVIMWSSVSIMHFVVRWSKRFRHKGDENEYRSYYLRNPKTKAISPSSLVPPALQEDSQLYARITKMCALRETMRERLKAQSKTEELSHVGPIISAIQAYLSELHWYISYLESNPEAFKGVPNIEFIWKSAMISRLQDKVNIARQFIAPRTDSDNAGPNAGSRLLGGPKQRRTQSSSIYMELGFTLQTLAVTKCMNAYSRIATLDTEIECETINIMTPGLRVVTEEEGEQGVEALKRASAELREAAGVFEYVIEHVLPQIRYMRMSVPDLMPEVQHMLQTLALADSDRLSVRVWLRSDKNQRKTPNMPANLLLGIQERYNSAHSSLRTLQGGEFRNASSDIQNYMRDGQRVILAQAMIYLAQVHSDNQKYGNAVGFMRDARELLIDVKKRNQSVHVTTASMLLSGPLEPLYSLYRRNNDTIGFESIPSSDDLRARLPSGRTLLSKPVAYSPS
ncbi:hypothetical protein LPJ62_003952 [Coemansia sp. RSA 2167]|nr:hypothetical protein LPJ62_003952 [Coemansia sp. RSA 2167]